jgi:DMSO/TMAO reductase YedYZ heme-binding membrane subunit
MTAQQITALIVGGVGIVALIVFGMLWAASDRAFERRQNELMERIRKLPL